MAGRYQELFRVDYYQYAEGCPLIIEAAVLHKDNETGKTLAQLKIRNISKIAISSCKVSIIAYENNGNKLEESKEHSYLDLNVKTGETFGEKIPIYLPDNTTRKISVSIIEVVTRDSEVYKYNSSEWRNVQKQKALVDYLGGLLIAEQYSIDTGINASFVPEKRDGLFFCSCGAINLSTSNNCYKCNSEYSKLVEALDSEKLNDNLNRRTAKEKEVAEENRKKSIRQTKRLVIGLVALLLICIGCGIGYKYISVKQLFDSADRYYDQGQYEQAFRYMMDLIDSEKIDEKNKPKAYYYIAKSCEAEGTKEFGVAITYYTKANGYADSDTKIQELSYEYAKHLAEDERYSDAVKYLENTENYKDTNDLISHYNNHLLYKEAQNCFSNHDISSGLEYMDKMTENIDNSEQVKEYYQEYLPFAGNWTTSRQKWKYYDSPVWSEDKVVKRGVAEMQFAPYINPDTLEDKSILYWGETDNEKDRELVGSTQDHKFTYIYNNGKSSFSFDLDTGRLEFHNPLTDQIYEYKKSD